MKNGSVRNIKKEVLSNDWYTLNKMTFEYHREDGEWEKQSREAYDCGDGAGILLYNKNKGTVILTKQFRMSSYLNGSDDGMLIEVCAGLLDGDSPEDCIKKEAIEETGYKVEQVEQVLEAYMVPGSVTQKLYLFIGEYTEAMRISEGGGADYETENIEVLEYTFDEAMKMALSGEIKDAKTIMLLQYAQLHKIMM